MARRAGQGCAFQIAMYVFAILLVIPMMVGVLAGAAMAANSTSTGGQVAGMALAFGSLTVVLGSVMLGGLIWVWARGRRFDKLFAPHGLSGRGFLMSGRQWHGDSRGRRTDGYFYRGPALDLYVACHSGTRVSFTESGALAAAVAQAVKNPPLDTPPELSNCQVHAHHPAWGSSLIDDTRTRLAIPKLMDDDGRAEIHSVVIQPEAVQLRVFKIWPGAITEERLESWLDGLHLLADVVLDLGAPSEPVEASSLERSNRTDRGRISNIVMLVTFAVFALMFLGAVVISGVSVLFAVAMGG